MRIAFTIETEHDAIIQYGRGLRAATESVPAVNLRQDRFHFWIALFILRIPPVQRAQRFIEWISGLLRFCDKTQSKLMHEPRVGPSITGRIDCFLAPLQKTLRIGERACL